MSTLVFVYYGVGSFDLANTASPAGVGSLAPTEAVYNPHVNCQTQDLLELNHLDPAI